MFKDFLDMHGVQSPANFVEYGYGQVEPNHLSAQRTGQIYAQLPADESIVMLEQGQFVKYDYAAGAEDGRNDGMGRVNFTGAGEWMLVYNETKLYRDNQHDCEFAMIRDNYQARIYSPMAEDTNFDAQSRYYNGNGVSGNGLTIQDGMVKYTDANGEEKVYPIDDVTAVGDYYEPYYTEDPFHIESQYTVQKMPAGTSMVPRVFKTNIGDIFTTNTIKFTNLGNAKIGTLLYVGDDGYLTDVAGTKSGNMKWQIVKVYTMPDHQRGVKIMRIE